MEKKIYWISRSKELKSALHLRDTLIFLTVIRYHQVVEYYVAQGDSEFYYTGTDDFSRSQDMVLWQSAIRRVDLLGSAAPFLTKLQLWALATWSKLINAA